MNILYLGTDSPDNEIQVTDFGRWLEHGGARLVRLAPEVVYQTEGMRGLEQRVLSVLREQRLDTLVYPLNVEFDFRPEFFRDDLRHVFKVLILGDDEHYFDVSHRYYAQAFDLVLTTNPLVDRYQMYGIDAWFIPGVFNPALFHPVEGTPKETDVSFVGALNTKIGRQAYAEALTKAGVDFRAYGPGTPRGMISLAEAIELYRRSRINLNFTGVSISTPLDADLSINRRARQLKNRCSMIALCGSFVLSEYAPGIEKLFDVGSEIDVFHNPQQLLDKVRYYLTHEQLREAMAAKAYQRALKEYDEVPFAIELVRRLEARAKRTDPVASFPIYLDKVFWSGFGAWRFKYLVIFAFSGKPGLFIREVFLLLRAGHCKPYAAMWFAAMGLLTAARISPAAAWLTRTLRRVRLLWRADTSYG